MLSHSELPQRSRESGSKNSRSDTRPNNDLEPARPRLDPAAILHRLRHLDRLHQRLTKHCLMIDARIQDAALEIGQLIVDLEEVEGALGGGGGPLGPGKIRERATLRAMAKAGVNQVEIWRLPDGSYHVRLDGGEPFSLPLASGVLLSILCRDDLGESDDAWVGWKDWELVAALLGKELHRVITKRVLIQRIHVLRQELSLRRVNRYLVLTDRRFRMRFALRRASTP